MSEPWAGQTAIIVVTSEDADLLAAVTETAQVLWSRVSGGGGATVSAAVMAPNERAEMVLLTARAASTTMFFQRDHEGDNLG